MEMKNHMKIPKTANFTSLLTVKRIINAKFHSNVLFRHLSMKNKVGLSKLKLTLNI